MDRRAFLGTLALLAAPRAAEAQPTGDIRRIGYLYAGDPATHAPYIEAFRQGLRHLGYTEGQNVTIEYRNARERLGRLPALAAELVALKVDVIVSSGATSTRSAKEATTTIPIVMAQDPDPVGNAFVASLARPGGNITGMSSLVAELGGGNAWSF